MEMQKCFALLKERYGTHEAAARAVGYERRQYQVYRLGKKSIPKRVENLLKAAAKSASDDLRRGVKPPRRTRRPAHSSPS